MAKAAKKTASAAPKKAAKKEVKKSVGSTAAKKTATKSAPKKAAKKAAGKTNAGLMAPLTVSPVLADVIGKKPMPRTEITKKIWDYIKANDLQDQNNKRMINTDEKLKKIFDGKDQISMFEIAKGVNNHVEK